MNVDGAHSGRLSIITSDESNEQIDQSVSDIRLPRKM
jgi:hypothetical protein